MILGIDLNTSHDDDTILEPMKDRFRMAIIRTKISLRKMMDRGVIKDFMND